MNKKRLIAYVLILLLTILTLHSRDLNSYFVKDDFTLIHGCYNKGPEFFIKLFLTDWVTEFFPEFKSYYKGGGFIRPIMVFSFKLDYLLYGTNPIGYHLTNLLIHFFNSLLVLLVISFITGDKFLGFVGAMLFVVHPVNSYSVAWISSRAEIMGTFCYILSFYFFINYRSRYLKRYYFSSLFFFLFGLFTKETVTVLLSLIICYDLMEELTPKPVNFRSSLKNLLKKAIEKSKAWIPYLMILVLYFGLRKLALGNFMGGFPRVYRPGIKIRIMNIITSLCFIFSSPFDYEQLLSKLPPVTRGEVFLMIFLFCFLLLPLLFIGIKNITYRRLFIFGILWSLIAYIPGFLVSWYFFYLTPLYLYSVIIGISCILVAVLFSVYGKKLGLIVSILLMIFYGAYQFEYNSHWYHAGFIGKQIVETINRAAKDFQKGDTIIIVDIPQVYKTAWVSGCMQDAFKRPFSESDIYYDFYVKLFFSEEIKGILQSQGSHVYSISWDEIKKILARTPMPSPWYLGMVKDNPSRFNDQFNHRVHLLKWNNRTNRLDQISGLSAILF